MNTKKIKIEHRFSEEERNSLSTCARKGYLNFVKLLLEDGVDIETPSSKGIPPLYNALYNIPMLTYLLENGANVNSRGWNNKTCLMHVIVCCDKENKKTRRDMIDFLLEWGIDVNAQDEAGRTALYYAVDARSKKIATLLLDHKADINKADSSGNTALGNACWLLDKKMCRLLVERGAWASLVGRESIWKAARCERMKIVRFLIDHGAPVINHNNKDIVLHAIETGHPDMAEYLIRKGAFFTNKTLLSLPFDNMISILSLHATRSYRDIIAHLTDERAISAVCKSSIAALISLLIARELCPASPFHKHRLPLDILRAILDFSNIPFIPRISQ
jgi:ankyrin repeat protein